MPYVGRMEGLLSQQEVERLTGLSRMTLYRYRQAGTFPPAVKRGPQKIGWHRADVMAWIKALPQA